MTAPADGVDVYLDEWYAGTTPFTVKILAGTHSVLVIDRQFKKFDEDVVFDNPGTMLLPLKPKYTHRGFAAYADLQLALPGSLYLGAALGMYYKSLNVEAVASMGLTPSPEIYWSAQDASKEPSVFTYSPLVLGGRIGFEIPVSRGLSITPRVGLNVIQVKGRARTTPAYDASQAGAVSAVADVRVTYRLSGPLYVKVQPEYDFPLSRTPLFEKLEEASPVIGSWANGFRFSAGVGYMF